VIYEINAWVWLVELSRREGRPVTLDQVPSKDWDMIAELGPDAVWLMGVWARSLESIRIARDRPDLEAEYRQALQGFRSADVVGSPYSIKRYEVDPFFGGRQGLAEARQALARRGMRLILDFVPNHVARDHAWLEQQPDFMIQGQAEDLQRLDPGFFGAHGRIYAHGKDPHLPPWTDTAQVNAFNPGLRQAAASVLQSIAQRCDGVRCDMAMLLVNRVFQQTWGARAGAPPAAEYWQEVIEAVRSSSPGFLLLAEAYWDMEWELLQQGFDFCYDRRLYEKLRHGTAEQVQQHLAADVAFQQKLVRFLENHDEPRAAALFAPEQARACAVAISSVPGAKLYHHGQFEGARIKLPVQLGRRPAEPIDRDLLAFYDRLMAVLVEPVFRQGDWALCARRGWPDNRTFENLVCCAWRHDGDHRWIIVNLSQGPAQGRVLFPWPSLTKPRCRLTDQFTGEIYRRETAELATEGLFVDLPPWACHFLRLEPDT
jgi:hypothetical protein